MLKPAEALGSLGVSASENPILCLNLSNLNQRESVGVRLHRHTGGSNAAPARGVPKAVFKWDEMGTRDGMQLRASSLLNLEGKPSKMGAKWAKISLRSGLPQGGVQDFLRHKSQRLLCVPSSCSCKTGVCCCKYAVLSQGVHPVLSLKGVGI